MIDFSKLEYLDKEVGKKQKAHFKNMSDFEAQNQELMQDYGDPVGKTSSKVTKTKKPKPKKDDSSSDEEYIPKKSDPNSPWAEYERLGEAAKTQPEINANNALLHSTFQMLKLLNIDHSYSNWKYQKHQISKSDLQKIENYKNPKSSSSKAKLIKEVEDMIKLISSVKIPKGTNSKNLSKAIELTELITKTPKIKKIKDSKNLSKALEIADLIVKAPKIKKIDSKKAAKEIADLHAQIDKVMKSKKIKPKIMQQAKGYEHKVSDVSQRVQNYVSEYKSIITSGKTQGTITKNINKLKLNIMTNMKPSEVDDANKLIADFKKTLPSTVKAKIVKAKVAKEPAEDADYQKLLKTKIAYIKKNKPSITDLDDIKILADEMIGKNRKSSKMCLEECINDLGMSGSGICRRKIKGGSGGLPPNDLLPSGDDLERGETDDEITSDIEEEDDYEEHPILEHENEIRRFLEQSIDLRDETDIQQSDIEEFIHNQNTDPHGFILAYDSYSHANPTLGLSQIYDLHTDFYDGLGIINSEVIMDFNEKDESDTADLILGLNAQYKHPSTARNKERRYKTQRDTVALYRKRKNDLTNQKEKLRKREDDPDDPESGGKMTQRQRVGTGMKFNKMIEKESRKNRLFGSGMTLNKMLEKESRKNRLF